MGIHRLYKGTPGGFIRCPSARVPATTNTCTWTCLECLDQLKQLPFADVSNFDTSGSSVDLNKERDTKLNIWFSFNAMTNNIEL